MRHGRSHRKGPACFANIKSYNSAPRRLALEALERRELLDAAGLVGIDGAVDLGDLTFFRDEHVNLAAGDVAYEFRAAHDAELTIDTTDTDGDCTIALYDSNGSLIERRETEAEFPKSSRVDYTAKAGEQYYVTISGTDSDLEVRIGNQLGHGKPMPVYGSAADDVFEVLGSTITINDIEYVFYVVAVEGADPLQFAIDGGGGNDTVVLRGHGQVEMDVWPDSVSWKSTANEVEATDVAIVQAYGHGDDDTVRLHGSPGSDKLKIYGNDDVVKLLGLDYCSRAKFFEHVTVEAGEGDDVARVWDAEGNNHFAFEPDESWFYFATWPSRDLYGYGFEDTLVRYVNGGTNRAVLRGSVGDELLVAKPHKTEWTGPGGTVTVRGSFLLSATGGTGGYDRAKLHGTTGADQFETVRDRAGLGTWREELIPMYKVYGFDWIKAYSHGGDEDVYSPDPEAEFETVLDGVWTETPRDELAEHLIDDSIYFF